MDLLGLFLHAYDTCQANYTAVDFAIRSADRNDLMEMERHASDDILSLYGGTMDLNRIEDTSDLVSVWENHEALGSYHLLAALDVLLADRRLEVKERAVDALSRRNRAVVPNPSFRLRALGQVHVARRIRENICSHLREFRVVVPLDRARIDYIPIGRDAPASFRERWGAVNDSLGEAQKGPCLRVFCANFSSQSTDFIICAQRAKSGWDELGFGTTFWFEAVNPDALEDLKRELKEILDQCAEIEAQVLVLPELTMPEELFAEVRNHRTRSRFPILTIAGSWHVSEGGKRINRAPVYAAGSRPIAWFDKMARYTMTPAEVQEFVAHVQVVGEVDETRDASEEISIGDSILVIDTDVGRLGISICIDAVMADLKATYEGLGLNYLFVPARSRTVGRFTHDLKTFCEHCAAFVCLANTPSAVSRDEDTSFILLPIRPARPIFARPRPPGGRPLRECERKHAILEPEDFV
jgi:predicted amidohydrolase